jgi:hypothetical protein
MKSKYLIVPLLFLSVIAVSVPSARAHEEIFFATLTGPNESPTNNSPGFGSAVVTLDLDLFTMRVQVNFADLTGTTTASHIHAATTMAFAGTAGVATTTPTFANFPLGVMSGTYDNTLDLTQSSSFNPNFISANGGTVSSAANALIFAIEDGKAYLNIHTTTFPGGEIRGFLAVPEPTTVSLLALGGIGVWLAARRKLQAR